MLFCAPREKCQELRSTLKPAPFKHLPISHLLFMDHTLASSTNGLLLEVLNSLIICFLRSIFISKGNATQCQQLTKIPLSISTGHIFVKCQCPGWESNPWHSTSSTQQSIKIQVDFMQKGFSYILIPGGVPTTLGKYHHYTFYQQFNVLLGLFLVWEYNYSLFLSLCFHKRSKS